MDSKTLYKLSYGVFVLSAEFGGKDNACITNTAIQVTSEPNQISICLNKVNFTHDMIVKSGKFTISVLSQEADFELIKHFGYYSGAKVDKFADYPDCARDSNGLLYITKGTNAYISVNVCKTVDMGTHTMFIGEISDMEILSDAPSLTYDYYQNNVKPKPEKTGKTEAGKTIWRCTICGHEYVGEELPDGFLCPVCNHPASYFEKIE